MRKSLLLLMTMILLFPSLASAQSPPKLGDYQLDAAILHTPVSSEPPPLVAGSGRIRVEAPRTPYCAPGAVSMVIDPPDNSGSWCFDSHGVISNPNDQSHAVAGLWTPYPNGKAIV